MGENNMKTCLLCGKELQGKWQKKFCSCKCASINSNRIKKEKELKLGKPLYTWTDEAKKKQSDIMKLKNTNSTRIWNSETLKKMSIKVKEFNKNYWTKEHRIKHSELMSKVAANNPESYNAENVSGRTKMYDAVDSFGNIVKLKGTWEVIAADFLNSKSIKWTKKITKFFVYYWEGHQRRYYPDFYLPEFDKYLEVKGYKRDRDIEKWKCVSDLVVFKKKEIDLIKKGIFEYNFAR